MPSLIKKLGRRNLVIKIGKGITKLTKMMMRLGSSRNLIFLNILLSFQFITAVASAAVTVQSLVDRNEMGMGDTVTLTVSVQSSESVDVSEPRVPNLDSFDLVNSWNSSSTQSKLVQGPNGMEFSTVRRQDFNYMITPKTTGSLSVPAIEVVVEGKTYYTKPIVISVSKQGSGATLGQRGQPQQEESEEEQIFNQLLQRRGVLPSPTMKNLPKNANESLSVQLEVDRTEVFEGEQIVASWYIYTRGNLMSLDRLKFPDLKGFWKEIIEEVPALNFTQEIINGVPYRKALLASHALFPIKPGTSIIDEYKIKGTVQIPTNPFSQFGMGQPYTFSRASERVKIKVNPLPTEGRPGDFSGAVGQFDVQASVEGNQFPVNQPFLFKVRFEGAGNAKLIELPTLNLPQGVEVYETKSESKYFKNGRSYKEFQVLIIPRQEGALTIPAMSFSMFDPQAKKYISRSTTEISLKIVPGASTGNMAADRVNSEKPAAPQKKVLKLPEVVTAWSSARNPLSDYSFGIVFLFIFSILGWKAKKEFAWGQKKKDLKQELQKRQKKVMQAFEQSDWRAVGTQMTNIFYYILGDVSGVGGANLEISRLLDQAPPSLRRELGADLTKYIEVFQVMSFAPEETVGALKEPAMMKKNIEAANVILLKAIDLSESSKS